MVDRLVVECTLTVLHQSLSNSYLPNIGSRVLMNLARSLFSQLLPRLHNGLVGLDGTNIQWPRNVGCAAAMRTPMSGNFGALQLATASKRDLNTSSCFMPTARLTSFVFMVVDDDTWCWTRVSDVSISDDNLPWLSETLGAHCSMICIQYGDFSISFFQWKSTWNQAALFGVSFMPRMCIEFDSIPCQMGQCQ